MLFRSLSEAFAQNRNDIEGRIGVDCSETTLVKYNTIQQHIKAFIKSKNHAEDIPLNELAYSFITDFELFMKTSRKCSHNTTLKYIQGFKKIIKLAVANDWLHKDPFLKYKEIGRAHV